MSNFGNGPVTVLHTPEFRDGVEAAISGSACPFDDGSVQKLCWYEGWKQGRAAIGRPAYAIQISEVEQLSNLPAPIDFKTFEQRHSEYLQFLDGLKLGLLDE